MGSMGFTVAGAIHQHRRVDGNSTRFLLPRVGHVSRTMTLSRYYVAR